MIEKTQEGEDINSSVFRNIPRKQKAALFVLVLIAVAIIIFWAWQFNTRLTSPFLASSDKNINTATDNATNTSVDLHNIDTDNDGLSDYDEINIYHTSPYLEDTDSDGIPDGVEVKNGTDPNCPTGKVCSGSDVPVSATSTTVSTGTASSSANVPALSIPADVASSSQQAIQDAISGKADAATLRQLLISSGADKAMLDQISDTDLMASYQQTLQNQNQAQTQTQNQQ